MQNRYFIQLKDLDGQWRYIASFTRLGDRLLYEERKHYFTEEKADELLAIWRKGNPTRHFRKIQTNHSSEVRQEKLDLLNGM